MDELGKPIDYGSPISDGRSADDINGMPSLLSIERPCRFDERAFDLSTSSEHNHKTLDVHTVNWCWPLLNMKHSFIIEIEAFAV